VEYLFNKSDEQYEQCQGNVAKHSSVVKMMALPSESWK